MLALMHRKIARNRLSGQQLRVFGVLPLLLLLIGCKADLYTQVQEREANEMLALLLSKGVDTLRVTAKDGTSTIRVEEKQLAFAIDLLSAEGLPRQSFKSLGEVFKGSGLIASPTEERARYVYALSEELSRTISDIDGVISARVHVVLPKNDLLRQDTIPSSASVFIRHNSNANLSALLPQIKVLIANSIEGLSYDKVAVVFVPVERPPLEHPSALAVAPAQSAKSVSIPLLAAVIGVVGAALAVLCYIFLGSRKLQGAQLSRALARLGIRSNAPINQPPSKKTSPTGHGAM